ncbi:hypothetical protein GCM10022223_10380 [Kineosporia mesophila]|uniref:HTH marR-type domain-containing protein n=1 Tax=Kineosporia mesophila TaxID=566012 RepID=A0ABP6Z503_9ACTN|nr:MarR family transcriptional regulator [Kineosporia mesophila]MCD5355192.1 MarR family transcriptional regulator [Kineosporia mesophila]
MTEAGGGAAQIGRMVHLLTLGLRHVHQDFAETVAGYGLSPQSARALVQLSDPAPMRDLAEQMNCDRSYVTTLADQLESRGLIERVTGTDRRTKLLALTEEGMAMRDRIATEVSKRSILRQNLTGDELDSLESLLAKAVGDGPESAGQGC